MVPSATETVIGAVPAGVPAKPIATLPDGLIEVEATERPPTGPAVKVTAGAGSETSYPLPTFTAPGVETVVPAAA